MAKSFDTDVDSLDSENHPALLMVPSPLPPASIHREVESAMSARAVAPTTVPNCCAVCLCPYETGDVVVRSSKFPDCPHAFHEECIVEWLVKMQAGAPCPCCRSEFIDLPDQEGRKADLLALSGGNTFDLSTISFR